MCIEVALSAAFADLGQIRRDIGRFDEILIGRFKISGQFIQTLHRRLAKTCQTLVGTFERFLILFRLLCNTLRLVEETDFLSFSSL